MNQALFPAGDIRTLVVGEVPWLRAAWASVAGLRKTRNEDVLDCWPTGGESVRACLCDGHWGDDAAKLSREYFFRQPAFPRDRHGAVESLSRLEKEIDGACGVPGLDGIDDTTPETSVLALKILPREVSVLSYGDCRCFVLRRDGDIRVPMAATWLGSFSRRGLRHRLSVARATYFATIPVEPRDRVVVFTDGIDECVYETPTIPVAEILLRARAAEGPEEFVCAILREAYLHGAEDNASVGLFEFL